MARLPPHKGPIGMSSTFADGIPIENPAPAIPRYKIALSRDCRDLFQGPLE